MIEHKDQEKRETRIAVIIISGWFALVSSVELIRHKETLSESPAYGLRLFLQDAFPVLLVGGIVLAIGLGGVIATTRGVRK